MHVLKHRPWLCTALTVAVCLAPPAVEGQVAAPSTRHETRVVSLTTVRPELPWYTITERIYRQRLRDALGDRLDYYSELLDVRHFRDPLFEAQFEDHLVRKYHTRPIDLLLVDDSASADVAGRLHARLASHPPIVFAGAFERPVTKSTGHTTALAMKESLELALRVHPETRHVFIVCGTSPADESHDNLFRSQVPTPPPGVTFTSLRGLSVPALTDRLAALPEHSVVFFIALTSDSQDREFRTAAVIERLVAASNAPIYTWNGNFRGFFGGRLLSTELIAEKTIQLALRVLRGERPEDIPITTSEASVDALDWRQLDRWNISEASIPPGVELRFREPGIFAQYRNYVLAAGALLLLQALLIAGLLIQRRNKQLAERSLRESEERFRVMADTAPVMIWRSGTDQHCDFFNQPWLEFRGRGLPDEMGEGWTEGVHPDDLPRCMNVYTGAWPGRESFRMEYRLQRADGEYRWVLDSGVPRLASDGAFLGYIGSCIDITERRQSEEALRANEAALRQSHTEIEDLAGRLITAQEVERARIARDLHDDISQQLAAISIAISECTQPELQGGAGLLEVLASVQGQAIELAEAIRLLSHDLHPDVLKHAGLVDALRSHCREFAKQHSIAVIVEADRDLAIPDLTLSLCLYRVVQEALRNVAKHADARQVHVTVRRVEAEVQLAVTDDGKGFEVVEAREHGGGLGLRSIEERVRLVGGRLLIETAPRKGTCITVSVKDVVSPVHEWAGV